MNQSEYRVLVFSGYNMRAVIAFIRTLELNCVAYDIVALTYQDYIYNTAYKDKVSYVRNNVELDVYEIIKIIEHIGRDNKKVFIAPTTEYLNRFLLEHRKELEGANCIIPLVDKDIYELISDKAAFYNLCLDSGICVPITYDKIEDFIYPVVAKPNKYISSDGKIYSPVFLNTNEECRQFVTNHAWQDFSFQEMLGEGDSIYLLFYFDKNGRVYVTSQHNLVQQPGGKSIIAAVSVDYHENSDLVNPYIRLFKKIKFRGLVMVEIRRIQETSYMIEANPRFWGPSQLFCDMGYNLFELLLYDYQIIDIKPKLSSRSGITYFWEGGIEDLSALKIHKDCDEMLERKYDLLLNNEIYRRNDTMELYKVEKLKKLYMASSKHSNYQILAPSVNEFINNADIEVKSRFEHERLDYICSKIDIKDKNILDIGGNTGFFTFESIDKKANHVDYYEGNKTHAEFVKLAAEMLELNSMISVHPEYYLFNNSNEKYDIVYNLNVVHHLGDDFGGNVCVEDAKEMMVDCINNIAEIAEYMVFQMGFNWKGNRSCCLFTDGTKYEMIEFLRECCTKWDIVCIGIACKKTDGSIGYTDLNESNINRDDSLGEFLNRPIFIMKKKRE